MALIPCPECNREISARAASCPHCGVAVAAAPAATAAPHPFGVAPDVTSETLVWEGGPSPRLLAREIPGMAWAVIAPPLFISLLPGVLQMVGGLHKELRRSIAEQGGTIRWVVIVAVLIASLARLGQVALRYARLKATRYRITNQRLTMESGLFSKRIDDVDLRSVEDVALEQSALERLLGVGRLNIVSADRSRPRLQLMGIRSPRELREQVRACAYQASQRQLFTRAT
jgi:membrane protein YdbS with pleckstrin-like domain